MIPPDFWLWLAGAYLLGGIPFGLLFSQALSNKDPRQYGSGNIGATNALRTGGKMVGALTLLADIGKGALPVLLVLYTTASNELLMVCVALAAFLGHVFPVYLRFRGGKGVATMLGVLLPWLPMITIIALVVWLAIFFSSRYVALASIIAAALIPVLVFVFHSGGQPTQWATIVLAVLVVLRHTGNIQRLLRHEEPKTGVKQG